MLGTGSTRRLGNHLANHRKSVFYCGVQSLILETGTNQELRVVILGPRLVASPRSKHNQLTSRMWINQGGGCVDRSKPSMVSRVTLLYEYPVCGLSCRSSACRRYRQPRSAAVPGHDETLSVSNQSEGVSSLEYVREIRDEKEGRSTHKMRSECRARRRHCLVSSVKMSAMSTLRLLAVAIAVSKRPICASLRTTDEGERIRSVQVNQRAGFTRERNGSSPIDAMSCVSLQTNSS